MPSDEETLLLIGGSSFLGLHTAETLYYFFNIICTYNQSTTPKFFPEFNWYQLNFLQSTIDLKINFKRLIEKTGTKYLVNIAGISSPAEVKKKESMSETVNDKANEIIAKVCKELGVVPIFISSDHVFHGDNGPYDEKEQPDPLTNSVYGNQKYKAEQYYQTLEKYVILRSSTTLGIAFNSQKQNLFERTVTALSQGAFINGASNKIRTVSHYSNIPFIINKIVEGFEEDRLEKETFHLPGELISEYDLMKKIAVKNNYSEYLINETTNNDDNGSYPLQLGLKSEKTVKKLRGRYLTLDEGISLLSDNFSQ